MFMPTDLDKEFVSELFSRRLRELPIVDKLNLKGGDKIWIQQFTSQKS